MRVRRALTLAIDRWHGAPQLAKIANVHTVGGIAFPGAPLAANKEELQQLAGYWPDIDKSRAEAKRLLKEAGAEGLSFELLNRNVDQPYKYNATWVIDEWSKIGLRVTQRVLPTGPWFEALRQGNFDVGVTGNCQSVVNPLLDVQRYLPTYAANYAQADDLRRSTSTIRCCGRRIFQNNVADAAIRETRDTTRRTTSFCCGGIGSCPIGPMSKAGRSARAITSTRIWRLYGSTNKTQFSRDYRCRRGSSRRLRCVGTDEEPKHGGTLTYMIPADAPPSFDGHRESTLRRCTPFAPFYSVLIRIDPENPATPPTSSAISVRRSRNRATTARPTHSRSGRMSNSMTARS